MEGFAPCRHKSKLTSMPEFPHPTTNTFLPANCSPDLYSEVCMAHPANFCMPGKSGTRGSAFSPVATTSHRAMSTSPPSRRTLHAPTAASSAASSTSGAEARRDARRRGVRLKYATNWSWTGTSGTPPGTEERQLAEALGQVESEAVVHAVAPRGRQRVGPLKHRRRNAPRREARRRGEPRRPAPTMTAPGTHVSRRSCAGLLSMAPCAERLCV